MATVEPYNLNWPDGRGQNAGGVRRNRDEPLRQRGSRPDEMNVLYNATSIPSALMFAALK